MGQHRLCLIHVISSLKIGGAETVLVDLITRLPVTDYDHHVIYFHDGPHRSRLTALGVPTYRITGFVYYYDPIFFWRLLRRIKELKPDLIHAVLWSATIFACLIGRLLKIPVIGALHSVMDYHGRIRNMLDRMVLPSAKRLIAVSDDVARAAYHHIPKLSPATLITITNGIDIHKVMDLQRKQQQTRIALGLSDEHFIIGSVGRFVPIKRYDLLLKAFAVINSIYPQTRLLLLGLGPQEQMLRDQVHKLGILDRVIFIIGNPAYGYYPLMDCFVQSSAQEGLSIALLEAMATQLPCVVTTVGLSHPVIDHEVNGLIAKFGKCDGIVEALIRLIREKTLKNQLGQAAYKSVQERFSLDKTIQKYHLLFKDKNLFKNLTLK